MEQDVEEILRIFEKELDRCGAGSLNYIQRVILQRLLACAIADERSPGWEDIAASIGRSSGHVRDSGSGLYILVRSVVGDNRRVNKATCGRIVREWYGRIAPSESIRLIGREQELQTLLQAIFDDQRRLICISGPPLVGKTTLVKGLREALKARGLFQTDLWCYATESPTVASLYQTVTNQLGQASAQFPSPQTALTHLLSTLNCLLVIEKTEVLHDPERPDGVIREASRCYEQWLSSLLDRSRLQSCVVVVCRHPPRCLRITRDNFLELSLRGLDAAAAEALLIQEQLDDLSSEELRQLAEFCGYNPGTLMAAAYKIRQSATGRLDEFTSYPLMHHHADDDVWHQSLHGLTPDERNVLGWLLLYPDEVIRQDGPRVILKGLADRAMTPIMQALRRRALIDVVDGGTYCLSMGWLRHVVARYLQQSLAQALEERDIETIGKHPLVVPGAPLWRCQWHREHVLEPVDQEWQMLNRDSWRESYRRDAINAMLDAIRVDRSLQEGFAAGNLLNIAIALKIRLHTVNASGLTLRHADLSLANLQGVNLTGCTVQDTVLPLPMYGDLVATLSPDGKTFAVGDETGRLLCWRREGDSYHSYRFMHFESEGGDNLPIVNLSFGNDESLAIAAGQAVYRWWFGDEALSPRKLMTVAVPITSLACCHDDYIAVGMADGSITVWNNLTDETIDLQRHQDPVRELVANPAKDTWQLISKGIGDRVLVWRDIRDAGTVPEEIRQEGGFFVRTTWQGGDPLFAIFQDDQTLLWMNDGTRQDLPFGQDINRLKFSHDGKWVAALKPQVVDIRNLADLSRGITVPHRETFNDMMLSNDGRWLLTKNYEHPHLLRIWDIENGEVCWELKATQPHDAQIPPGPLPQLQACQGLTTIERAFWASYGAMI